jgi:hypothetical protein
MWTVQLVDRKGWQHQMDTNSHEPDLRGICHFLLVTVALKENLQEILTRYILSTIYLTLISTRI